MTTFYLIRHAQRTGDQEMLAGRLSGFGLTTTGMLADTPHRRQHYRVAAKMQRMREFRVEGLV